MPLEIRANRRNAVVVNYTGTEEIVDIPGEHNGVPVTEIRADAFCGNTNIVCVFLPLSIRTIHERAFLSCTNLRYVGYASNEEKRRVISEWEQSGTLPVECRFVRNLSDIKAHAFSGTQLQYIMMSAPQLKIGDGAFMNCRELSGVQILSGEKLTLGKKAFAQSGIKWFSSKAIADCVEEEAFANCQRLVDVHINTSKLKVRSFYMCSSLKKVSSPTKITKIGKEAFEGCGYLKKVTTVQPNLSQRTSGFLGHKKHSKGTAFCAPSLPHFREPSRVEFAENTENTKPVMFTAHVDAAFGTVSLVPKNITVKIERNGPEYEWRVQNPGFLHGAKFVPDIDVQKTEPFWKLVYGSKCTLHISGRANPADRKSYEVHSLKLLCSRFSPDANGIPVEALLDALKCLLKDDVCEAPASNPESPNEE